MHFMAWMGLTGGLIAAAVLVASGFGGSGAVAQDSSCTYRGTLADRYCDMNRDMLADQPLDSDQWADPATLIFSYVPVEDPAVYKDTFAPFMEHLAEVTGKNVRFFSAQSNAAQIEALRSGRLHIAGLSTGATAFGVNIAGFHPFAIMGTDDGGYGYKMEVITPANSPIDSVPDLKGKRVAHTEQSSNSGNQAPRALLESEFGIVPGEDYEVAYSGGHDRSILGVANGDYAAAPVASTVLDRMVARGAVDMNNIRVIHTSRSFPTTGYGYAHDLHPRLKLLIQKAFYSFDFAGTKLGEEFSGVDGFLPITYKKDWKVIRTIQQQNDVSYTRDNISG